MKRLSCAAVILTMLLSAVCAYNPPAYGDSFYELSSPRQLTNGASCTGGGIYFASPESITVNPALTAREQRIGLNLAYTGMISSNDENSKKYGNAFQAGILIPFKWAVLTGYMNGTMVPFKEMDLGDSLNLKAGLSKEITDALFVGANLNTGIFWGADTDWALSANLGFVYDWGNLSFIKDFRFGGSLLNVGKNYNKTTLPGINSKKAGTGYPAVTTFRAGAAGTLYKNDIIQLGASADLTIPMFINGILDVGLQFSVKDSLYISVAEKLNIAELVHGVKNVMPAVGISYRFTFDVKNSDYLNKNGWNESEMSASVAWKQFNGTINAVSAGVDVDLGLKDETPPVITILWDDDPVVEPAFFVGDAK